MNKNIKIEDLLNRIYKLDELDSKESIFKFVKLIEEIGELAECILMIDGYKNNMKGKTIDQVRVELKYELSDIFMMVMILCNRYNIPFNELVNMTNEKCNKWEKFINKKIKDPLYINEVERNKKLIYLTSKLIDDDDKDGLFLLETMVKNDTDSMKKTFNIINNGSIDMFIGKPSKDKYPNHNNPEYITHTFDDGTKVDIYSNETNQIHLSEFDKMNIISDIRNGNKFGCFKTDDFFYLKTGNKFIKLNWCISND